MEFSDKLSALLSLAVVRNSELADALGLGRPYISRLRSGERKMPHNAKLIQDMSTFFASQCHDEARLRALRELTSDMRLSSYLNDEIIATVIYEWLTGSKKQEYHTAGRFLSTFDQFSDEEPQADGIMRVGVPPSSGGISVYYKNEGKRQALWDLITYIRALSDPCIIRIFSDESYDWLLEDAAFSREVNAALHETSLRGFQLERIQPPYNEAEYAFASIERWLPCYMSGGVFQYHYPWARDRLHRRTIMVVPGRIAMYSNSIYGEDSARTTFLTRLPDLVRNCNDEYDEILKRCHPTMNAFTADTPDSLFSNAEIVAAIEDDGVYKSSSLSINTLPPEVLDKIRTVGFPYSQKLYISLEKRARSRTKVLRNHKITDIMCLPGVARVMAGEASIPGTQAFAGGKLYYTLAEYKLHLERILWHLNTYPNYMAIFIDDDNMRNIVVYVKGDSRALLIKTTPPFAVFDITEHTMATSFCDYLRNVVAERIAPGSRRATIDLLKQEIQRINELTQG